MSGGNGSTSSRSSSGTSPVIQSGIEVLAGHHPPHHPMHPAAHHHAAAHHPLHLAAAAAKESSSLAAKLGLGFDPSNPAFRPAGLPGYPSQASSPSLTGSGPGAGSAGASGPHAGVCRDPFCRDPTCPTAGYNAYLARLSGAVAGGGGGGGGSGSGGSPPTGLPPGYLELLEAYKMYAPSAAAGHLPPVTSVPSSVAVSAASAAGPGGGGPYICNWMAGREYCGKRYTNAEELLVHLKTHTSLSVSESTSPAPTAAAASSQPFAASAAAAAASAASLNAAYSSLFNGSALAAIRGPYPSALSLAASRYSPYGKPPAGYPSPLPPSLSGLGLPGPPPGAAAPGQGLHPSLGGLSPYLSPGANPLSLYSLYGARL